jgi:hypothetical protein
LGIDLTESPMPTRSLPKRHDPPKSGRSQRSFSNGDACSVSEWGTVLNDQVVATAILDRLLHHSHVLTIRGDSYRLREKRRSGLLKSNASSAASAVTT